MELILAVGLYLELWNGMYKTGTGKKNRDGNPVPKNTTSAEMWTTQNYYI